MVFESHVCWGDGGCWLVDGAGEECGCRSVGGGIDEPAGGWEDCCVVRERAWRVVEGRERGSLCTRSD